MSSSLNPECLDGDCERCPGMGCEHWCHQPSVPTHPTVKKPSPFAGRREWKKYEASMRALIKSEKESI